MAGVCEGMGLGPARSLILNDWRHVASEVFYDGGWHYLDVDVRAVFRRPDGTLASFADARKRRQPLGRPRARCSSPTTIWSELEDLRVDAAYYYHYGFHQTGHTMDYVLRQGETFTRWWKPQGGRWHHLPAYHKSRLHAAADRNAAPRPGSQPPRFHRPQLRQRAVRLPAEPHGRVDRLRRRSHTTCRNVAPGPKGLVLDGAARATRSSKSAPPTSSCPSRQSPGNHRRRLRGVGGRRSTRPARGCRSRWTAASPGCRSPPAAGSGRYDLTRSGRRHVRLPAAHRPRRAGGRRSQKPGDHHLGPGGARVTSFAASGQQSDGVSLERPLRPAQPRDGGLLRMQADPDQLGKYVVEMPQDYDPAPSDRADSRTAHRKGRRAARARRSPGSPPTAASAPTSSTPQARRETRSRTRSARPRVFGKSTGPTCRPTWSTGTTTPPARYDSKALPRDSSSATWAIRR